MYFLETKQVQFEHYLSSLNGRKRQRDAALAELRVAFYLHRNTFRVSDWRPIRMNGREGEYLVRGPVGTDVFVEVKGPTWQFELSDEELRQGRQHKPKDLSFEVRDVEHIKTIQFEVEKAYGKFAPGVQNLLVISDNLFVSLKFGLDHFVMTALYDLCRDGCFVTDKYRNLGGVGIFWTEYEGDEIWYEMRLFLNPHANVPLPDDLALGFRGFLPCQ